MTSDKVREKIIKLIDALVNWGANRPIKREKDPQKRFEMKLWLEIRGLTYDGESNYKRVYYEKLLSEDERMQVRSTLLTMLKSDKYSISNKAVIAYVCTDIGISEALQDVNDLRKKATITSFEKQMLSLAYEALSRGITVHELVYGKDEKSERM